MKSFYGRVCILNCLHSSIWSHLWLPWKSKPRYKNETKNNHVWITHFTTCNLFRNDYSIEQVLQFECRQGSKHALCWKKGKGSYYQTFRAVITTIFEGHRGNISNCQEDFSHSLCSFPKLSRSQETNHGNPYSLCKSLLKSLITWVKAARWGEVTLECGCLFVRTCITI